jgi:hypothetical protein
MRAEHLRETLGNNYSRSCVLKELYSVEEARFPKVTDAMSI